MRRASAPEILDRPHHDPDELGRSLDQVAAVNRWLGGERALRRTLRPLLSEPAGMRLLDVGAGNARVALALTGWAARRGRRWRVTALDLHAQTVVLAAGNVAAETGTSRPVPVLRGDALALPFAAGAFDVAYTVLTLHHFDGDAAVALLREMARVVRRRVVVNDLERTAPAFLAARLLAATVWRGNPITRHDGPLSVRRAFTPRELMELAERAGLGHPRVRRFAPFRLVLEADP